VLRRARTGDAGSGAIPACPASSTHLSVLEPAGDAANVVLTVQLVVLFQLALQLAALLSPGRCCHPIACTLLLIITTILIRATVPTLLLLLQLLVQQRKAARCLGLVTECCHCCWLEDLILCC
jgi:hypothetical protein